MFKFDPQLRKGIFVYREKRFLSYIQLENGNEICAHCANTGRMTGLLNPGSECWVREQMPRCKLPYAWELVRTKMGLACINTHRANQVLASEASDLISSWCYPYYILKREPSFGSHRFDLELTNQNVDRVFVEVKTVTLSDGFVGYFPDTPSKRAQKHLSIMIDLCSEGVSCWLVFVVMIPGITQVSPAFWIDPIFTSFLRLAKSKGVKLLAFNTNITPQYIKLGERIPVRIKT